jgi:hypothetical protein
MALLKGEAAMQAAGKLLPAINRSGAKKAEVESAVDLIEETPDVNALFSRYASDKRYAGYVSPGAGQKFVGVTVSILPKELRLAFEMASHEDSERRALEGSSRYSRMRGEKPRRSPRLPTTCS